MSEWKEGARRNAKGDCCPNCGKPAALAWDFKRYGKHSLIVCENCDAIYVDGQLAAKVEGGKP